MVVKRIVRVLVNEAAVDEFEYQTPLSPAERMDLELFLIMSSANYPGCVFACVNTKDGVGEDFSLPDTVPNNLF